MRIGIDALPLSRQRTGIGNYLYNLVSGLSCLAEHDYFLYSNRRIDTEFAETSIKKRVDSGFHWCPGSLWLLGRSQHLIASDNIDVFWATGPVLPRGIPRNTLKIVTVYDLVWLRHPETMARYTLFVHKMCAERSIANADLVVTISSSTRNELVETLGISSAKTRLVYPAASETYKPLDQPTAAALISAKYGFAARYLATAGTVEPRKNLEVLVQALGILKHRGELSCPLVVAGAKGWKNSALFRAVARAGLSEKEIKFIGYLPDEEMATFYAGAQIFLFPSLYEGFGIPPIEAMACGTPVIASDSQCMPETLGTAAMLVPARSPELFASAISRVLSDDELRRAMSAAGIRRAQQYQWNKSAKQMLEILSGSSER